MEFKMLFGSKEHFIIQLIMDTGEILIYQNQEGKVKLTVTDLNDTFWITQKAISALFGGEVSAISKHLSNIYKEGELSKDGSTISILETVKKEGNRSVKRNVEF